MLVKGYHITVAAVLRSVGMLDSVEMLDSVGIKLVGINLSLSLSFGDMSAHIPRFRFQKHQS